MRLPIPSLLAALVTVAVWAAVAGWAVLSGTTPAAAGPLSAAPRPNAHAGAVELVGQRTSRRYRDDDATVDAPFTYVETRRRRTAVDAPFTSVRVGRRGTWVRAPFVDLFVPR